jgi:hypothetical protein
VTWASMSGDSRIYTTFIAPDNTRGRVLLKRAGGNSSADSESAHPPTSAAPQWACDELDHASSYRTTSSHGRAEKARSRPTLIWCSRAVNRSCLLSFAACRTPRNPWDTRSLLCVGLVLDRTMFSLVHALPSPISAGDESPLFGWFTGDTAQSDSSETCASALWLGAFADRSRSWSDRDVSEVSRFSCKLFLSVPWFSDYAGPAGHSRSIATGRFAFPVGNKVQHPDFGFSKLNCPAHCTPVYASTSRTSRSSGSSRS